MNPSDIAAHIDERFPFFSPEDGAAASKRHQTLRATVDWSYSPFSKPTRAGGCSTRLQVFSGGFRQTQGASAGRGTGEGIEALGRWSTRSRASSPSRW